MIQLWYHCGNLTNSIAQGTQTFDIFGDTFLKGIYAIFDMGKKRFGAVQRIETSQNLAPGPETSS